MKPLHIEELIQEARAYYQKRNFLMLEPMLQELIASGSATAEVFHMQANLHLSRGQFSKAIQSFKRALEIDPGFTEASVGLSVLLNDLGKYEEAKTVYQNAEKYLEKLKEIPDSQAQERLASKHEELADIYLQVNKYPDAIQQLKIAASLSLRKPDLVLRIADIYAKSGGLDKAIRELRQLVAEQPQFLAARVKMAKFLVRSNKNREAIDQLENVLMRDPQHPEAIKYLKILNPKRIFLTPSNEIGK